MYNSVFDFVVIHISYIARILYEYYLLTDPLIYNSESLLNTEQGPYICSSEGVNQYKKVFTSSKPC